MGNLCASSSTSVGSSLISKLVGQYGESSVLGYAQSIIGNTMVGQQFSNLRNVITQKFNTTPQASSNPGMLDQILGQVNNVQAQQKQNIMSLKPSIPELDNAPVDTKNAFMKTMESKFSSQIGSYKTNLMSSLAPQLDVSKYLPSLGSLGF